MWKKILGVTEKGWLYNGAIYPLPLLVVKIALLFLRLAHFNRKRILDEFLNWVSASSFKDATTTSRKRSTNSGLCVNYGTGLFETRYVYTVHRGRGLNRGKQLWPCAPFDASAHLKLSEIRKAALKRDRMGEKRRDRRRLTTKFNVVYNIKPLSSTWHLRSGDNEADQQMYHKSCILLVIYSSTCIHTGSGFPGERPILPPICCCCS